MNTIANQRTALVTGGGSGMGEATSKCFASGGMAVGVLDVNRDAATRVAGEINASGGRALALHADVANRNQIDAALTDLRSQYGAVTVLVNNAAIDDFCPFMDITEESWDRILGVNLKSVLLVSQAVIPDMQNAGWGRIINIASFGAQMSTPNMAHYCASKGGIIALTRSQAADLGRHGITANTVSPGFIDTPMSRKAMQSGKLPADPSVIYGAYPIARLGKPEDIAAACAFFASEEAGYVTAQLLGVNGGAAV